jgi:capsular polysaccharide transport system permease protein
MSNTEAPVAKILSFEGKDADDGNQNSDVIRNSEGLNRKAPRGVNQMIAKLRGLGPLFLLTVVVPTIVSTIYFGFLASDVYISESRFVVRSPDKPQKSGLGMILDTAGFASAGEEVQAAKGFIESRDGLRALNADGYAKAAWERRNVSVFNRFNPLGFSGSFEDLFDYYQSKVKVEFDAQTGITTLSVRAFTPKESLEMNERLLDQAESLVNQLNERGRGDLITYAEREVAEAQAQASEAALALAKYRNSRGVIDPERQATVQLQMISKLQDELIGARMQLLQISSMASENPQIPMLRVRIRGLQKAIQEQLGQVAGAEGSLSEAAAQFQELQLRREFADRQLGLALSSLQDARNEARRQQAYVERVAQPSLPDDALEPRRIRGILATLIVGLIAWGIMTMLLAGVREHKQ